MAETTALSDELCFPAVPVPGSSTDSSPRTLLREIDAWISSEAFCELVRADAGDPIGTLAERLAYLDGFSAVVWDFRSRAARRAESEFVERNQVAADEVRGRREQLAVAAARALGFGEARAPLRRDYDHVLVHGGLVRGNIWRSAYAAHLLLSGQVRAPSVTALTTHRLLARNEADPDLDEPSLLRAFRLPERVSEDEVMADALTRAFGLDPPMRAGSESSDRGVVRRVAPAAPDLRVGLVTVPPPRNAIRADTASALTYWADEIGRPRAGQAVLVVTSAIFAPFQHADAIRTLGLRCGVRVETIGVDHSVIDPAPRPAVRRAVHYLQEIRSTVRAYRQLVDALASTGGAE